MYTAWRFDKIRKMDQYMIFMFKFDSVEKLTLKYVFTTLGGVIGFPA